MSEGTTCKPAVLLIEDVQSKADIYIGQLEEAGVECVHHGGAVESFEEVVAWAARQVSSRQFDALILDLHLRGLRFERHHEHELDGLEVYYRLLKNTNVLDRCGQIILASRLFGNVKAIENAAPGRSSEFILKVFLGAAGIPFGNVFSLITDGGFRKVVERVNELLRAGSAGPGQ